MRERKKLSAILAENRRGGMWIDGNWDDIPAAPEFGPIPPGRYVAHLMEAGPFQAKTGTPGFKLTFEIIEGDFQGRKVWFDIWLTEAAKSNAKRDLEKLGIKNRAQLERPIPHWIRCAVRVVVHKNDQGEEFNVVKTFEVIGIDQPERDPFAPSENDMAEGGNQP